MVLLQKLHAAVQNYHYLPGGRTFHRDDVERGREFWTIDDNGRAFKAAVDEFVCHDDLQDAWYKVDFENGVLNENQVGVADA